MPHQYQSSPLRPNRSRARPHASRDRGLHPARPRPRRRLHLRRALHLPQHRQRPPQGPSTPSSASTPSKSSSTSWRTAWEGGSARERATGRARGCGGPGQGNTRATRGQPAGSARRAAQTCASPSRDEWGRDPVPLLFRRAPSGGTHVARLRFRGSSRSYEMNSAQAPRAAIKQQDERRTEAWLSRPPHTG